MRKLWQKDLILLKQYQWSIIVVYLVCAPAYYLLKMDVAFSAGIQMIFILIFFGVTILQLDTANKGYQQLFSLPITRQDYVHEKFLLFGGMLLSASLCNTLMTLLINLITGQSFSLSQLLTVELASLLIVGLAAGVFLANAITKGRQSFIILIGSLIGVVMALTIFGLFLESHDLPIMAALNFFLNLNPVLLIFIGLGLFALEWLGLCRYTKKRFEKVDINTMGSLQNVTTMGKMRK